MFDKNYIKLKFLYNTMDKIYVLMAGGDCWEDMVIYLTETQAIDASRKFPNWRVEIFTRRENDFVPCYQCYRNGVLHNL